MDEKFLVGTKGRTEEHGIYLITPDDFTNQIHGFLVRKMNEFSFIASTPDGKFAFAAGRNEENNGDILVSLKITAESAIEPIDRVELGDAGVSYISVDDMQKNIFITGYTSGTVYWYRYTAAGKISCRINSYTLDKTRIKNTQQQGDIFSPACRQDGPHPHSVYLLRETCDVLVPDLGQDMLWILHIEDEKIVLKDKIAFREGTGPRHLALHPDLPYIYMLSELSSELGVMRYERSLGKIVLQSIHKTLPENFRGDNLAADILISKDGKTLYVSDRGINQVCVYSIEGTTGEPILKQRADTAGWPRGLKFSKDGRRLYILNEAYGTSAGSMEEYRIGCNGLLTEHRGAVMIEDAYNFAIL